MSMNFPDKPVAQLVGASGPIHAVCYSASPGSYILTGSADRSVRLYNPAPSLSFSSSTTTSPTSAATPQGRLIQTYSSHSHEVVALTVSRDNTRFASAGGDRAVCVWDVVSSAATSLTSGPTPLRRLAVPTATGRVNAVLFSGGGLSQSQSSDLLISGHSDTCVRVWDVRSPSSTRPVQTLPEARDAVTCLAVSSSFSFSSSPGAEIIAGSVDGRVRTYDVRTGKCTTDLISPAGVTGVCLSRDARTVLVATLDGALRLMDRERGACLKRYGDGARRNEELRVQGVLGGQERWVVSGDEMGGASQTSGEGGDGAGPDGRVWAWDLMTGKVVARLRVPWGPVGGTHKPKKVVGRDGKEKERRNVVSCLAWKNDGFGDQFCVGGTSGVVTVFGSRAP